MNPEHQAQIYACLWMLMAEKENSSFLQNQQMFVSYWESTESQFTVYYRQEYQPRAGNLTAIITVYDFSNTHRKVGPVLQGL